MKKIKILINMLVIMLVLICVIFAFLYLATDTFKSNKQLFKSYIKLFILCNKFKDYRLVDNNLNIITDKEKYLKFLDDSSIRIASEIKGEL